MIRTLSTLILVAGFAGPALAQEARVSIVGKDDATVRAEIHQAAKSVCRSAYVHDKLDDAQQIEDCIDSAETDGVAQLKAYRLATSASPPPTSAIASLAPARPGSSR
jgi:hypothetical protein